MKIVVLDGYTLNPGDLSWSGLEAYGELITYDRTSLTDQQEIITRIGDADAVFTNKTPLSKKVIDACPKLKFIGVLATGYNVVDVEAARRKDIPVSNIPTYGTAAVGLDVVSTEPIQGNNPLLQAPNCLITPHISWAPKESRSRLMDISVFDFNKFFIKGHFLNEFKKMSLYYDQISNFMPVISSPIRHTFSARSGSIAHGRTP